MPDRPKVVITYNFHAEAIGRLFKHKARVILASSQKKLKQELQDAHALITLLTDKVDAQLLNQAPALKVVGNMAVGVDNIDLQACAKQNIKVVNTPDVLTRATAEMSLALLMAAARRIPEGEKMCRTGKFKGWQPDMLLGHQLQGRQAMIVGAGRIGSETARLFKAVGMKVDSISSKDGEESIQKKLSIAQVLSIHLPLNSKTRHWLNSFRIRLLPSDCIVINTARGPIIDESALIRALQSRKIFAAALDVYEKEPQIPAALRKLDNVVLLPHLGSATEETRRKMAETVIEGVLKVLSGKRAWNQVKVGYGPTS